MSRNEVIKSMLFKAERDAKTAEDLFKLKHYDWCLFIWHLAIEKILKACILKLGKEIIYTHDLAKLAKLAGLEMSDRLLEQLYEVTTYNLEARYDDYKLSFYKKATKDYTKKWSKTCENIYMAVKNSL